MSYATDNFTSLCEDSADCVSELTSLADQVTHWKIAAIAILFVILLVVLCLCIAQTLLKARRVTSELTPSVVADDVEQNQQIRPVLVDVTCATPAMIPVEYQLRTSAVRKITIKPRKPVKRLMSTVSERSQAGNGEASPKAKGLKTGLPIEWLEMDSYRNEHGT